MTERARVSAPLLDVLGKQSFRALEEDPRGLPSPLLVSTLRAEVAPYPHSLRGLAENKGDRTGCKSRRPTHSPPSASIIPMLHVPASPLLHPQEKAHREESLQSRPRQPQGPRRRDCKALRQSLGVTVGPGERQKPAEFPETPGVSPTRRAVDGAAVTPGGHHVWTLFCPHFQGLESPTVHSSFLQSFHLFPSLFVFVCF